MTVFVEGMAASAPMPFSSALMADCISLQIALIADLG